MPYSTSTTLALLGTEELLTLGQWRATTHLDAGSVSVDPRFVSTFDLHATTLTLRGLGVTIPGIATDIDGDRRNPVRPDIGADERRPYREAPTYVPFPSDRTDWRIGVCGFTCDTSRIWVRGDTTINGTVYHRVYRTGDTLKFPATGVGSSREPPGLSGADRDTVIWTTTRRSACLLVSM